MYLSSLLYLTLEETEIIFA